MFGLRRYQFNYSSSPEIAARKLAAVLEKQDWSSIVSEVTPTRVKLYKRLPALFHNSFNPIFVGHFKPTINGAALIGIFRMHWLVIAFLLVFFGAIGYNVIDTYLQPEHRDGYVEGWRHELLVWHLEFLGFALLVPIVGWLFGLPNKNAIIRAIKQSI